MLKSIIKSRKCTVTCSGEEIKLTYCLISEGKRVEGIEFMVYGIMVMAERGDEWECEYVKDISPSLPETELLLEKMSDFGVTPATVCDIVNDYVEK